MHALQVADAITEMLLGKDACQAAHATLKRQFRGAQPTAVAHALDMVRRPYRQRPALYERHSHAMAAVAGCGRCFHCT